MCSVQPPFLSNVPYQCVPAIVYSPCPQTTCNVQKMVVIKPPWPSPHKVQTKEHIPPPYAIAGGMQQSTGGSPALETYTFDCATPVDQLYQFGDKAKTPQRSVKKKGSFLSTSKAEAEEKTAAKYAIAVDVQKKACKSAKCRQNVSVLLEPIAPPVVEKKSISKDKSSEEDKKNLSELYEQHKRNAHRCLEEARKLSMLIIQVGAEAFPDLIEKFKQQVKDAFHFLDQANLSRQQIESIILREEETRKSLAIENYDVLTERQLRIQDLQQMHEQLKKSIHRILTQANILDEYIIKVQNTQSVANLKEKHNQYLQVLITKLKKAKDIKRMIEEAQSSISSPPTPFVDKAKTPEASAKVAITVDVQQSAKKERTPQHESLILSQIEPPESVDTTETTEDETSYDQHMYLQYEIKAYRCLKEATRLVSLFVKLGSERSPPNLIEELVKQVQEAFDFLEKAHLNTEQIESIFLRETETQEASAIANYDVMTERERRIHDLRQALRHAKKSTHKNLVHLNILKQYAAIVQDTQSISNIREKFRQCLRNIFAMGRQVAACREMIQKEEEEGNIPHEDISQDDSSAVDIVYSELTEREKRLLILETIYNENIQSAAQHLQEAANLADQMEREDSSRLREQYDAHLQDGQMNIELAELQMNQIERLTLIGDGPGPIDDPIQSEQEMLSKLIRWYNEYKRDLCQYIEKATNLKERMKQEDASILVVQYNQHINDCVAYVELADLCRQQIDSILGGNQTTTSSSVEDASGTRPGTSAETTLSNLVKLYNKHKRNVYENIQNANALKERMEREDGRNTGTVDQYNECLHDCLQNTEIANMCKEQIESITGNSVESAVETTTTTAMEQSYEAMDEEEKLSMLVTLYNEYKRVLCQCVEKAAELKVRMEDAHATNTTALVHQYNHYVNECVEYAELADCCKQKIESLTGKSFTTASASVENVENTQEQEQLSNLTELYNEHKRTLCQNLEEATNLGQRIEQEDTINTTSLLEQIQQSVNDCLTSAEQADLCKQQIESILSRTLSTTPGSGFSGSTSGYEEDTADRIFGNVPSINDSVFAVPQRVTETTADEIFGTEMDSSFL